MRESCLQTGTFICKLGISVTKQDFHLQRGSLVLQMGFSAYYLPKHNNLFHITLFWICIIFLNLKVMNTLNSFLCISSSSNHTFQGTFPEHMQTFCIIIFWNTMSVILITSSIEMSNHLLSVYNLPESHCSVIHRSNLPHTSFLILPC